MWRAAQKIVFSNTLDEVTTPKTRIERVFSPQAVRALKDASDSDISIGGPGLAANAIAAGLVDEYLQFVMPVIVGGGTHWLPKSTRADLELQEERRFGSGVVYLRYSVR